MPLTPSLFATRSQGITLILILLTVVMGGCHILDQLASLRGTDTEKDRRWIRKDSDRGKLIIFVHGFNSSNHTAWDQFPSLLMGDDDFRDFNIVLYGYPTKFCSSVDNIHSEGEHLASFLREIFENKMPEYRRIVLVGHSMGGLVLAHALLDLELKHFILLREQDLKVLTFGTPYIGVENVASLEMLLPVCKNKQTEEMEAFKDSLYDLTRQLTLRFNQATETVGKPTPQIPLYTFHGKRDLFVSKASACGYAKICEGVDGDHYSIVKPMTRAHLSYTKLQRISLEPQTAVSVPTQSESEIVVQGVMAIPLREETIGPVKVRHVRHRLGFIVKVLNLSTVPKTVEVVILEGCVPIEPWFPREVFLDRDLLPEQLIFNEDLDALARTAVQKIRVAGAVRADSRVLPPGGFGYVGVLLPLELGGIAKLVVEDSASLKGPCSKITKATAQPSINDLLTIGAIHHSWKDLAQSFRDGSLKIKLHVGGKALTVNPSLLGKLYSLSWKYWGSLDLARMYEVPQTDYPPIVELTR